MGYCVSHPRSDSRIGRGVPNDWGGCASVVEYDRVTGETVSVYM